MLPRSRYIRVLPLLLVSALWTGSLVTAPAQALTRYTPPVTVTELSITPTVSINPEASIAIVGNRTTTLLPAQGTSPFSLVGLTWIGSVSAGTEFKVRVRESGTWSGWFYLEYDENNEADKDGSKVVQTRVGSEPLLTGLANGVEVVMENSTGMIPSQMKVALVHSDVTNQDRNIGTQSIRMANFDTAMQTQSVSSFSGAAVSPQGALVPRPRIVSRAEWGADETWRDPVPRVGTTLLAGFVHHTASTNEYTADQAPAQMRNLYAYFTQSLNYADMGYNFLIDKYGTIYEGRSGCAIGAVGCDSPTVPVIGAHTAGLNLNTFAVSAIGNYDVLAPQNPGVMVESIAALMAWKLAPYGLDPNAMASIESTDTSGNSKYSAGQTAITAVISAHRDVGKTVCPGRYLYPYLDEIRARATVLLAPAIQGFSVTPNVVEVSSPDLVTVAATIPVASNWSVTVKNADSSAQIQEVSGTQEVAGPITYIWDRKDSSGTPVPIGRYAVVVNVTVGDVILPPVTQVVAIATMPAPISNVTFTRISKTKTKVSWLPDVSNFAPVTSNLYRVSTNNGATWSAWKSTKGYSFAAKWRLKKTYTVEIKSVNALGESTAVRSIYKVGKFAPPKPSPVIAISLKHLSKNRVTLSWTPAPSDFSVSGYYYRVAKNGGKYSKWAKSAGVKTAVTLSKWKGNSTYKVQIRVRNIAGYSPVMTTSFTTR